VTPGVAGSGAIAALRPELETAARTLGIALSAAQVHQLLDFLALLERWNRTYNLTAIRSLPAMLTQHVFDCLAAAAALRRRFGPPLPTRILDVGSGGGLPGVVLAIVLPETQVTCVDRVGKKAAFVRQVAGSLALPNLESLHARVEDMLTGPFDIVTARAFASLVDLVAATRGVVAPDGAWMAMKGKSPDAELAALPEGLMFHVEPLTVPKLEAERCLVWITHTSQILSIMASERILIQRDPERS